MYKRKIFVLTLGLAIFILYLSLSNPFKGISEAGRFNPFLFFLAFTVDFIGIILFAISWHILVIGAGMRVRVVESLRATLISFFIIWLIPIPIGLEIIRAYLIKGDGKSNAGKAVSSVLVHKSLYNLSFGIIIAIASGVIMFSPGRVFPLEPAFIWFMILFGVASSTFFLFLLDKRRLLWVQRRFSKFKMFNRISKNGFTSLQEFSESIEDAFHVLKSRRALLLTSFIMISVHWSTGSITTYLVALSLGFELNIWHIVLVYAIVEFIQQLNIIIPGGIGVIDAGLTGALTLIGVSLTSASAISLLTRLDTYWFEIIISAFVTFHSGYKHVLKGLLESRGDGLTGNS